MATVNPWDSGYYDDAGLLRLHLKTLGLVLDSE